ncbi:homeobox protein Meis3-like, partial [Hyalella azteca]|uniref:Homeobox protein Meis3-like n=1 Tax=Hyalella azteca TaxID=294128 RepID=A0A8B7P5G3_HYAAZ
MPRHKFSAVGSQDFEDSSPEGAASVSMNFRSAATRNIVQPTEAPEGNGVARKRRPNLRPEAKAVLTAWLTEHRHHPYPTEEEKDALVCEAGVTLAQGEKEVAAPMQKFSDCCTSRSMIYHEESNFTRYPSTEEKLQLAQEAGLNMRQ